MTTRGARFIRGWIAAAISVFVAVCSHALAGGQGPGAAGLALCLAFAGPISVVLAGKSLSLPRLILSVIISQFLFHAGFSLLGSAGGPTPTTPTVAHWMSADMHVHALNLQAANSAMTMARWMWAAHATAAVITILALRFGELAFWQLLALARPFLLSVFGWAASTPLRPAAQAPCRRESLPRRLAIVSMLSLRGPPPWPAR